MGPRLSRRTRRSLQNHNHQVNIFKSRTFLFERDLGTYANRSERFRSGIIYELFGVRIKRGFFQGGRDVVDFVVVFAGILDAGFGIRRSTFRDRWRRRHRRLRRARFDILRLRRRSLNTLRISVLLRRRYTLTIRRLVLTRLQHDVLRVNTLYIRRLRIYHSFLLILRLVLGYRYVGREYRRLRRHNGRLLLHLHRHLMRLFWLFVR